MQTNDARKEILDRIKTSLRQRGDKSLGISQPPKHVSEEYFAPLDDTPEFVFARSFVNVKGKFSFCENERELIQALKTLFREQKWIEVFAPEKDIRIILEKSGIPHHHDPERMKNIQAGITGCEFLVARSGSILVSSEQTLSRKVYSHSPQHIVIAKTSQLVNEMKEGIEKIRIKYGKLPGMLTAISGPSRTADIEKTLVLGAHGPEELYVFLVNDK